VKKPPCGGFFALSDLLEHHKGRVVRQYYRMAATKASALVRFLNPAPTSPRGDVGAGLRNSRKA